MAEARTAMAGDPSPWATYTGVCAHDGPYCQKCYPLAMRVWQSAWPVAYTTTTSVPRQPVAPPDYVPQTKRGKR